MLSRLLIVRLKAAERALKDGRYDDAFRLATEPDIRQHRRGAAVLKKLTDKYIARAREHFKADRFSEALLDLTKAEAGGAQKGEIAELREQVQVVAEAELRKDNSRRLRLEAARRRIERGSLAGGQRLLEEVQADDPEAQALRQRVESSQDEADEKLNHVERLLKGGQVRDAVSRFERAKALNPQSIRVAEIEAKLAGAMLQRVRDAVNQGQLSRAADDLASLGKVGQSLSARREMEEIVERADRAARAVAASQFEDALQEVLRLSQALPKAAWVQKSVKELRQLDELLLSLRTGPLGQTIQTAGAASVADRGRSPGAGSAMADTVALGGRPVAGVLPERLLLLVDGGGSYLLHRGERVSVGRAAATHPADVPIFSDLSERHADVARVEDDYFLFAPREVEVSGRRTRHQLLRDNDRVVLARRAKFTFRLPNRKSGSAVMDMSDSTRLPNDVRRVVLFKQTAMMGFGSSVHVSCSPSDNGMLLFERAGRLWVRPMSRDGVQTEARPVSLGASVEMCGVSFVIRPWDAGTPGQSLV